MTDDYILEMHNISKEFPGVKALSDVTFNVRRGEIHALCGENGAGKSTLMKILSGVYPHNSYSGEIVLNRKRLSLSNVKDAENAGIAIIHQEMALFREMAVYENVLIGNERHKFGIINLPEMLHETKRLLERVGLNINPATPLKYLGTGQQQLVEIAKALAKNASVLILDEPTASLSESDVETLVDILHQLKAAGVTCIYISHKLDEVFRIADSISVLRDGCVAGTRSKNDITRDEVIRLVVGREITTLYPPKSHVPGERVFEVSHFTVYDKSVNDRKIVDDASFYVRKGEILGFAGLIGAGRTELLTSVYGYYTGRYNGKIVIDGREIKIPHPSLALKNGIAMVPEDRKAQGIIGCMDVKANMTISNLEKYIQCAGFIDALKEIRDADRYIERMRIKTPGLDALIQNLSGGNQQKVLLARSLLRDLKVLFIDEPTRGIDVGARYEIYSLIDQMAKDGLAIVMVSSDLTEVLGMADRIMVMAGGRVTGEFVNEGISPEDIMRCAVGGKGV